MNRYKFRAECQRDVDLALAAVIEAGYLHNFCIRPISSPFVNLPDRLVEMTAICDLSTLQSLLADIPDLHVIRETLQHAANYTGERGEPEKQDDGPAGETYVSVDGKCPNCLREGTLVDTEDGKPVVCTGCGYELTLTEQAEWVIKHE